MNCENCFIEHEGSYGSGRFCSSVCSRSFSTKAKREQINLKVKEKLSGRKLSEEHKINLRNGWKKSPIRNFNRIRAPISEICALNSNFHNLYIKKRLLDDGLKKNICEECGIKDYNNKPLTIQIHHMNGNRSDNRIENLQMLCPNCHSQTENYAGRNRSLRNFKDTLTELE